MNLKRILGVYALLFLFLNTGIAQLKDLLPRSTPEAESVSSKAILDFLDAAAKSKHEFHSIMILRHGKVIAEGWWSPYKPQLRHTMYSVSKSFTATAVGFAINEKRLSVNDKVLSFFPEYAPETVSENLAALTVKDLLSMSVGQDPDPTGPVVATDTNWVKGFLAKPVLNKPGTKFLYNSLGTYMLSAIVQKVTGQRILDYLKPRLFTPLGIENMDWEIDPKGINSGGWGLRVRTEDMAKFGQLFLQKGQWKGKQILPASWVEEASTKKIDQNPDATPEAKASSDWLQGYCYQMWRSKNNAYRGDGAFGQYIIVMPDQDAVVVITSETTDMQGEINLVWEYLLPGFKNEKPNEDAAIATQLKKRLATLTLTTPQPAKDSVFTGRHLTATYKLNSNDRNFETISFNTNRNNCVLSIKSGTETYNIKFGNNSWLESTTNKLGPSLVARAKNHFAGLPPPKIVGAYRWTATNTLELTLRYIESPHTETFTAVFNENDVSIHIKNSFEPNKKDPPLVGILQK